MRSNGYSNINRVTRVKPGGHRTSDFKRTVSTRKHIAHAQGRYKRVRYLNKTRLVAHAKDHLKQL